MLLLLFLQGIHSLVHHLILKCQKFNLDNLGYAFMIMIMIMINMIMIMIIILNDNFYPGYQPFQLKPKIQLALNSFKCFKGK